METGLPHYIFHEMCSFVDIIILMRDSYRTILDVTSDCIGSLFNQLANLDAPTYGIQNLFNCWELNILIKTQKLLITEYSILNHHI